MDRIDNFLRHALDADCSPTVVEIAGETLMEVDTFSQYRYVAPPGTDPDLILVDSLAVFERMPWDYEAPRHVAHGGEVYKHIHTESWCQWERHVDPDLDPDPDPDDIYTICDGGVAFFFERLDCDLTLEYDWEVEGDRLLLSHFMGFEIPINEIVECEQLTALLHIVAMRVKEVFDSYNLGGASAGAIALVCECTVTTHTLSDLTWIPDRVSAELLAVPHIGAMANEILDLLRDLESERGDTCPF